MSNDLGKKIDLLIEHSGIGLSEQEQELFLLQQKFSRYQHKAFYSKIKTDASWKKVIISIYSVAVILPFLKYYYGAVKIIGTIETFYYSIMYICFVVVFFIMPGCYFYKEKSAYSRFCKIKKLLKLLWSPFRYILTSTIFGITYAGIIYSLYGFIYVFLQNKDFTKWEIIMLFCSFCALFTAIFYNELKAILFILHPKWKLLSTRNMLFSNLLILFLVMFLALFKLTEYIETNDPMEWFKFIYICISTSNFMVFYIVSVFDYQVTKDYIKKYEPLLDLKGIMDSDAKGTK